MSMEIQVDGVSYLNFLNASVEFSLTNFARFFDFTATSTEAKQLPFKVGDSCQITIDKELVLTGFIERMDISYSGGNHTIRVSGRDKVGDLVDSSLEKLDIQGDISFEDVIRRVLEELTFSASDILVINLVEGLENFVKDTDILSPSTGQNSWDFLETLARKKNVLLRTNNDGDILIERSPEGNTGGASEGFNTTTLANRLDNSTNNILSSSTSFDDTQVFNKYTVRSQSNVSTLKSIFEDATATVDKFGEAIQEDIRTTRQLVLQAENASVNDESINRAQWEANFRQARQRVYSCTINGFRDSQGVIWDVNQLIRVDDDFAGINGNMLIDSVTFIFDLTGGEETTLSLVQEGSYLPEVQTETSSDVGTSFINS